MAPDPNLTEYKRMYRHDEDDSAVNYQLFAEMKELKPNLNKLKNLSARSTRQRKRKYGDIGNSSGDSDDESSDDDNEAARKKRKTGAISSINTGKKSKKKNRNNQDDDDDDDFQMKRSHRPCTQFINLINI